MGEYTIESLCMQLILHAKDGYIASITGSTAMVTVKHLGGPILKFIMLVNTNLNYRTCSLHEFCKVFAHSLSMMFIQTPGPGRTLIVILISSAGS